MTRSWCCPGIVAVAIAVMVARIVSTYHVFGDTIDEPYHIGAAVALYEAHKHVQGTQSPPLARLVAGLPLVFSGVETPPDRGRTTIQSDVDAFEVGDNALLHSRLPYWSVLSRARAAMLVFPVAVVVYVYLLGRLVAGRVGGMLAAICVSTDPTLLGHGGLVTSDLAAVAGYLAAVYHGTRWIGRPTLPRAIGAGVALGLAVACKLSCAVVIVALVALMVMHRRSLRRVPQLAVVALAAFGALWATYLFDVSRLDDSVALNDTPEWNAIPGWLKRTPLPMPSLIVGSITVWQHDHGGHISYLNGQITNGGSWLYFPEAIALKSPLAVVIGIVIAVAGVFLRRSPRRCIVLLPLIVFLAASMMSRLNIGVRHVLPAIPLLYVFMAQQLVRMKLRPLLIGIAAAAMVETVCRHPDYLTFFNVLAGGPSGGDAYLLDSNLDWGQDQARLARWLDEHATGRAVTLRISGRDRVRQWPHSGYEIPPPTEWPKGLLAISKNERIGLYHNVGEPPVTIDLSRLDPVARIGYSIEVYDLDAPGRR